MRTEVSYLATDNLRERTLLERRIVVDSTARNPLIYEGTVDDDEYTLAPGTVLVPVSALNGRYVALQRSPAVSRAYGTETEIVVDDASPFRVGDTIRYRDVSDSYTAVAIGVIADIHYDTNTLDIAGDVASGIAADDPVEVAYLDADMVLLGQTVCVLGDARTAVSVPAWGMIAGQIEARNVNMVGDWDDLLAQEMPGIDFIPTEPGTGKGGLGTIGPGEIEDDAVTASKIAEDAVELAAVDDGLTLGAIICLPVTLVNIANNDLILDGYVPGFRGKILKLSFVTGLVPASTSGKDIDLTCLIGATPTTGGLLTLLTANCDAKGEVKDATAITAANIFGATDTISVKCVEATAAFAEGVGTVVIVLGTA